MKERAYRSLLQLAVADGATTPVPTGSDPSIIWSTTENLPMYWSGSAWLLLKPRNQNDVFRCDWFIPPDVATDVWDDTGLTIDFTHQSLDAEGDTLNNPVTGQIVYIQPNGSGGQDPTTEGVWVLGSTASPSAVPVTRHPDWPATRVIYPSTEFVCARGPDLPLPSTEEVLRAADVNISTDEIDTSYLNLKPGQLVELVNLDSGAVMPGGLPLGMYYVDSATRYPDTGAYGYFGTAVLRTPGGGVVNITSVGTDGSSTFICNIRPKTRLSSSSPVRLRVNGTDEASGQIVWGTQSQISVLDVNIHAASGPNTAMFGAAAGRNAGAKGGVAFGADAKANNTVSVAVGSNAEADGGVAVGEYSRSEVNGIALGQYAQARENSVAMLAAATFNQRQIAVGNWPIASEFNAATAYVSYLFQGTTSAGAEEALDGGSARGGTDVYIKPGTVFTFEGVAQAASNVGVAAWTVRGIVVRQATGNSAVQAVFTPVARSAAYSGLTLRLDVDATTKHLKALVTAGNTDVIEWTVMLRGTLIDSFDYAGRDYAIDQALVTSGGAVGKYTQLIGNGSATTITVTHSLGNQWVTAQLVEVATGEIVAGKIVLNNTNSLDVVFVTAPSTNQYRINIVG